MSSGSGITMVVLVMGVLSACQANVPHQSSAPRILTSLEMEHLTAGSSAAINDATASALGTAPSTMAWGTSSADSDNGLIVGTLDYTSSKAQALAHGENIARTRLSSGVSVSNNIGTAALDGVADGVGSNGAEATTQLYGVSTKSAIVVFGSIAASACCDTDAETHADILKKASGLYTNELRSSSKSYTPAERQSRVDISVVVSALPILGQSLQVR
jgi:hypothetical protein